MLLLYAMRNIRDVFIMYQKYKKISFLPIPAFYSFALIALSLRPVYMVGKWTADDDWKPYVNIDWVQQGAKLCVGLVQDWTTLELAIRIHVSKGVNDISDDGKLRLRAIFKIVYLVILVVLIAFITTVIVSAHLPKNDGWAFLKNNCQVSGMIGYTFLGQFIVMSLLVTWLYIETLREDPFEKAEREFGDTCRWRAGRKRMCSYLIVSAFFALSYIGRFFFNDYFGCNYNENSYAAFMVELAVLFFEGVSMGALMCIHATDDRPKSMRRNSSSSIKPVYPAGTVVPIHLFMLRSESDESDRLDTSINDAREDQEQARIRFGSSNSDDSTQLIPPQNAPPELE